MTTIKHIVPSYCDDPPSNQTMIDILAGSWVSSFPARMGLSAGGTAHFDQTVDSRVNEVAQIFDLRGKSVCELGPLEAYQTKHLCDAGAGPVLSVEANDLAFIKCLIVKELFGIPAKFMHGSALKHLEHTDEIYDVIWASGILYHQADPFKLLKLICDRSNAFFLWSHYWSQERCGQDPTFDPDKDLECELEGTTWKYHYRGYMTKGAEFSGGVEAGAYWIEKPAVTKYIESKGFKFIYFKDFPEAQHGPVFVSFAVRT